MAAPIRFPYTAVGNTPASLMPRLPLLLTYKDRTVEAIGLFDTGTALNVLPYSVGVALGANWDAQTTFIPLVGALGHVEARALMLRASHPQLTPGRDIRLAFAWLQTDEAPVLFGQVNFFMAFNVCFYRTEAVFEVHPLGTTWRLR